MNQTNAWSLSLDELVSALSHDDRSGSAQIASVHARQFSGVGTDTRVNLTGLIFFALKGDVYDAHDFVEKAVDAGAAAVVVHAIDSNRLAALAARATVIVVPDTLRALQNLAHHWRHKMPAKFVGITGTNGKTTTKEFAAQIIGTQRSVHYSKGSFNNHWGVPLTLLSVLPDHEVAVIEMGMNHIGELRELSSMVDADAVVCTMVGRGHLEGVGSIEGVARAKSEIYQFAPPAAARIFNLDNECTQRMRTEFGSPDSLTFGTLGAHSETPTVSLEVVAAGADFLEVAGQIAGVQGRARTAVFGRHNVVNLMAASCLALQVGLSAREIWQALPLCKTVWGRNQWLELASGARALFDAYNANPESMRAALNNFAQLTGRKIAFLGEMRELGAFAEPAHREMAREVARSGFDRVVFIGPSYQAVRAELAAQTEIRTQLENSFFSETYEEFLAAAPELVLNLGDLVLIKGSRGMQLERVLKDFAAFQVVKPEGFQAK